MIPRDYITEWRASAPWVQDSQVEQDLIISRALVELFTHPVLGETLAFRGGTALYKLYLTPAARYSEDIDLVQVRAEPAGPMMEAVREALDPWLGRPVWKQTEGRVTFTYRFFSEDPTPLPLRLKIEVNTREHFAAQGFRRVPFAVSSRWFAGDCDVPTYGLDELLGTKLRALHQRRKGRDLFDMWAALTRGGADPARIVSAFLRYMSEGDHRLTRAAFEETFFRKLEDQRFLSDVPPLLASGEDWDPSAAAKLVEDVICPLLPGDPWSNPDEGRSCKTRSKI